MKKTFLIAGIFALLSILTLDAQVTIGLNQLPNSSAVLDLQSKGNLGLLLPRVALTDTLLADPLSANVAGMLVYNLNTSDDGKVVEGVYINDGRRWWPANGEATGPWNISGTTDAARLNTQDIYQTGRVTIGMDTLQSVTMLNVVSDNKGIMIPRMTLEQRNGIDTTNANSLMIYNTDEDCYNYYSRSIGDWQSLCGGMAKAAFTVGSCDNITVNGAYIEGNPLNGSNYLSVKVDVTKAGNYTFTATTENGYGFTGSGTILDAPTTVILLIPGQGTPKNQNQTPGDLVSFISSGGDVNCTNLRIPVLPATATYDITCGSIKANGAYVKNVMLDPTINTLTLLVNVTSIDNGATSWTIRTNSNNGISFLGSGVFNATGTQQVTLQGAGTPNTTDPIPLTLTANSAGGESTCNFTVTIAYPVMSIYTLGTQSTYGYNVGYAGAGYSGFTKTGVYGMLTSQSNFGTSPNSTVKSLGFKFTLGTATTTGATIADVLQSPNPPDIVVIGYSWTNTDGTAAQAFLKYLQAGGVMLMFCEDNATTQIMMRTIFGDNTITVAVPPAPNDNIAGCRYQILMSNDLIINGPFGNVGGLFWGEDATYTREVTNIINSSNTILYSKGQGGNPTAFRHASLKLVYTGDGGFTSNDNNYAIANLTVCPFQVTDGINYIPVPKQNYGTTTTFNGIGPVYNSQFFANMMAWALSAAMDHGINPH